VLFTTAPALVAALAKAHAEGRLDQRLGFFAKPKLLIIDELGYLPFEPNPAHLFIQLVSKRYVRGSLLITSNRSVGEWGSYRHPRSAAPPQPGRHHPRRQLPPTRETPRRAHQGSSPRSGPARMTEKIAARVLCPPVGYVSPRAQNAETTSIQVAHHSRLATDAGPDVPGHHSTGVSFSCRQGGSSGCRLTPDATATAAAIRKVVSIWEQLFHKKPAKNKTLPHTHSVLALYRELGLAGDRSII
jgi:hypothetical protein